MPRADVTPDDLITVLIFLAALAACSWWSPVEDLLIRPPVVVAGVFAGTG